MEYDLEKRTLEFGKRIIKLSQALPKNTVNNELIRQLVKAGTSIGANYREANGAESKKDFTHKIRISLKEAKETNGQVDILTTSLGTTDLMQIFKVIEKQNIPLLIHTRKENNDNSDPDRLLALVEKYKGINFIFGHFANAVESVIEKAKSSPNLFLETSIVSSPKIIEMAVKKCGSEKILFGSDFPYSDQELELQKVLRSEISSRDKENILYRNALTLLGREKIYKLRTQP